MYCTLVDVAPADVVLGLGFRRKFNAPYPPAYPLSQSMGVTSICLGVPKGYGLYFPKGLQNLFRGRDPADAGFCQILHLQTPWMTWNVTGKRLTPTQLSGAVTDGSQ